MQDIESILKALEPLIRGASIDIIENTKKTVFKNALSLFQEIKNSDYFSSSDKDSFLALGVKLHNKARNLTNESYSEIRSLLKSCAAFIFLGVSQNMKLQGAITVLKILSKSGQEFQLFPLLKPYALICSVNATKLWGRMNSQDLNIESLPTPEVQIIKLHAYQALIDVASQSDKADEIRAAVTGAMDAVRELSIGSKLSFGRNALQVGMRQVDMDVCADAIITFRLICQALDGVLSNATAWKAYAEGAVVSIENEDGKNNRAMSEHYVYVMKIKAQLAMVFAFTQMDQPDKALLCLQDIEKSSLKSLDAINNGAVETISKQEVKQAICRAKFAAYVRLKDWQDAESALRALVSITSSYTIALESVSQFLDSDAANKRNYGTEYYALLLTKFHKNPEFTETRICQLLSTLSELMFPDTATTADVHTARQATMTPDSSSIAVNCVVSSNDPFRKCLELCSAIITDHIRGPFMLTDRQFLQLIELCFGQISCHRSQCTWTLVQSWSELTLLLLRSSVKSIVSLSSSMSGPGLDEGNSLASLDGSHISIDVNRKIALVMLHKADALSRLNQHNQALEVVSAAVKTLQDPSTLTTSFLITLRAQGGQSAVSSLITLLDTSHTRKTTSGLTDTISRPTSLWKDTHHLSTQSLVSDLDILVICLKQVLDVEVNSNLTSECVIAQTLLLKEWLRRYQQSRHWRTTVDRSDTAVNENISYFAFTSEVIRRFLNKFMHSVEKVKPTINKSDTIAQTSFVASVSGITSDNTIHSSKRPLESAVENSQSKRMHIEPTDADTHKDTAHIADICAAIDSSVAVSNSNGAVEVVTSTAMITTDPVDSTASQETKVQGGDSCPMEDTPLATPLTTQMATDEGEIVTSVLVTDAPTLDSDSSNNKNKVAEATAEKETAALDERTSDETKQHVLSSSFNEKQPSKAQRIQTLFDEDANSQYEFMCRVEDLRDEVLCMLEDTLRTVEMAMSDDVDLQLLGSPKHLEWLPEVAWNLSAVVLREKSCKFQGSIASNMMTDETQLSNSEETVQRLLLGADFAEKADLLYALVPYEDRALSRQNQSTCLLVASGARLTVDVALLTRHSKADAKSTGGAFSGSSLSLSKTNDLIVASSSHSSANETVRENLAAVERNCVKVDTMMRSSLSFAVDEQLQTIRRINMIFHFTLMCKLGGEKLSAFVKERKLELLQLSAEKLIECSDIARQERGGTAEAVRAMLLLAQQVCMREQITRKSPLNTVFVRLIEFSNSREQALAKIEEFEQLLLRGDSRHEQVTEFSEETIHSVLILTHNYGVQLLHLGDIDLAERFVSKALNLSRYAPKRNAEIRDSIQCTYTSLLEAKQRRQKRSQDIANSNNKLGLDFGTDMTEERALDQLLLDDTAGGQKRVMDGPLSNAHLFA